MKHKCFDGEEYLLSDLAFDYLKNIIKWKKSKGEDVTLYIQELNKRGKIVK